MSRQVSALDLSRAAPWLAALLMLALLAFWPTYLSIFATHDRLTHAHAATATLWMVLLVVQPLAIRQRRYDLHRRLGRLSYLLAPLVLLSILLLAQHRIAHASGPAYPIQTYILYLQVSLAFAFGLSWVLAIHYRRNAPLHARFMLCTALTLIDPIVIRLLFWIDPTPEWNYQWFTFGLTDVVLLALIQGERHARSGRWVFPAMLAVFALLQAPALLGATEGAAWQAFARAVAGLNSG
jgi:hypothetical protein